MTSSATPKLKQKVITIKNLGSIPDALKKPSKLDVRCKDCISFEKGPFTFGRACKLNGVLDDRPAPGCFNPDFTKLILGTNPHIMQQLGFFLANFNSAQTRILSSVINRSALIKKHTRFAFGQDVYINMSGSREFLSNYFKGYVVGYLNSNKTVFVSARMDKKRPYTSSLMVLPDTLMTKEEFDLHSAKMLKSGKTHDPKFKDIAEGHVKTINTALKDADSYEPPTLENAPTDWLAPLHRRHQIDAEDAKPSKSQKKRVLDTYEEMDRFSIL